MKKRTGTLFVFLAALLYSIGGLCIKLIPWNGLSINGGRCAIALVVLGAYLAAIRHKPRLNRWVLLGSLCIFGTNTLFSLANKPTTATNTIVLQTIKMVYRREYRLSRNNNKIVMPSAVKYSMANSSTMRPSPPTSSFPMPS